MATHLFRIPDNDLVIGLPRGMDQLQSDASYADCQPVWEHLFEIIINIHQ